MLKKIAIRMSITVKKGRRRKGIRVETLEWGSSEGHHSVVTVKWGL
jgi:hypothetical protein